MYRAEISRDYPTVLLFLLDQSDSMSGVLGGGKDAVMRKDESAADVINKMLDAFVHRCSTGEDIRNYFDIGVIGYGREKDWVGPVFEGALEGRDLVSIGELGNNPAKVEEREKLTPDGAGGVVKIKTKFPTWFSPTAGWNTPMCKALEYTFGVLEGWVKNHADSYPPIVVNITDGQSTDGDPTEMAFRLTSLSTDDGNVLLFNCHLSEAPSAPILFPDDHANLPDDFAKLLFNISSVFPESTRILAASEGFSVSPNSRGFVFNADFVNLYKFLDIGTRTQIKDS